MLQKLLLFHFVCMKIQIGKQKDIWYPYARLSFTYAEYKLTTIFPFSCGTKMIWAGRILQQWDFYTWSVLSRGLYCGITTQRWNKATHYRSRFYNGNLCLMKKRLWPFSMTHLKTKTRESVQCILFEKGKQVETSPVLFEPLCPPHRYQLGFPVAITPHRPKQHKARQRAEDCMDPESSICFRSWMRVQMYITSSNLLGIIKDHLQSFQLLFSSISRICDMMSWKVHAIMFNGRSV